MHTPPTSVVVGTLDGTPFRELNGQDFFQFKNFQFKMNPFLETVHEVIDGTVNQDMMAYFQETRPDLYKAIQQRAKFEKKTKVEKALIMKKLGDQAWRIMHSGFQRSKGCKRFAPRKQSSTLKKVAKKLEKVKTQFMFWGFSQGEWAEFVNKKCAEHGLRAMFE